MIEDKKVLIFKDFPFINLKIHSRIVSYLKVKVGEQMSDKKPLTRSEVPVELTWDLTLIYPDNSGFEADLAFVSEKIPVIAGSKETALQSGENLYNYLLLSNQVEEKIETAYVYSHLKADQDTTNDENQVLNQRAFSVYVELSGASSWFEPAILEKSDEEFENFFKEEPRLEEFRVALEAARIQKGHVLSDREEALLSKANEVFSGPGKTFNFLNNADLKFGTIKNENGEEVELTHGNYITFLESTNREVRKNVFETKYKPYIQFKNTFASTLGSEVKAHNFKALAHNYESSRQAALSANQVPEEVYDALLTVVNEKLPLLHRYIALQQKALGLDELHMYDLHVPITGEAPIKYNYEEASKATFEALKPLGEEYQDILKQAYEQRWIDVAENIGKRSGGYSSGAYTTAPYILLNWHDDLSNFFTLVHELGHSAHSYFTRHTQPFQYGDYSIFLAEIASTTNENLLTDYLLKKHTDKESQIYILNNYLNRFKSTIFRQTQFAEFEHQIHVADQNGEPLTQAAMAEIYANINKKYYANVIQDEEIAYEWTRIPHFYMNYYVYQYATGMAAATALADKILHGTPEDLEAYLNYLRAGRSDKPIEVMKKAGVDMTQTQYLYDAMNVFEQRLEQLEALLNEE